MSAEEPRAEVVHLLYRANLAKYRQDTGAAILAAAELDALDVTVEDIERARTLMLESLRGAARLGNGEWRPGRSSPAT